MATTRPKRKTKGADEDVETTNGSSSGNKWQQLLDDLNTGASGPFFFPKAGKIRFRVVPEEDGETFFSEVESTYRGRTKSRYLIRSVILKSDQGELSDQFKDKIVPLVLPKSAFKQIIELLAEDYDLFDWEEGHGLTLQKSGSGTNTSYSIIVSRDSMSLSDDIEEPQETLEDWAEQFAHRNSSQASGSDDEDDTEGGTGW